VEFFRIRKDIPLMRHALVFNVISMAMFVIAVFFLATRGLNFGVDFTGGTVLEISYTQPADLQKIRGALEARGFRDVNVQAFGTSRDVLIRMSDKQQDVKGAQLSEAVMQTLKQNDPRVELKRVEFVGPQVGKELANNGALALLFVSLLIVGYLGLRFESWKFGVAAVIANMHDVVIILGFFAFFQWDFSLAVLAGVLAVLGYSVNESVVVFDRIRETFRKKRNYTTSQIIDHAITATMSRTVITHGSTELAVLAMLFFGGEVLHNFALALAIGILFGVYSAIFVSSPIIMWLGVTREDLVQPRKEAAADNQP
jgi:preprotein translocase subunit SecF